MALVVGGAFQSQECPLSREQEFKKLSFPQGLQGPPAHKVHLAPTENIQDETFIGIWEFHILLKGNRNK